MTNKLTFDILGASFSITADEDEVYLNEVLAQYHEAVKNTQTISGINEPLNIAILTGYLLCDKINKIKEQLKDESTEAEQRTLKLIAALEQVLNSVDL